MASFIDSIPGMYNKMHGMTSEMIENAKELFDSNLKDLSNHIIPEKYLDMELMFDLSITDRREYYTELYGFSLISYNWLRELLPLIKDRKCLEVISGTGMLTHALNKLNVDCIATDDLSWENDFKGGWKRNHWCDVENIDCISAIEKYGKDVRFIFMSWAPYNNPLAYNALLKMREVNPKAIMIYIGEDYCGCTGDDNFYDNAEFLDIKSVNNANKLYCRFGGIHDRIFAVK